MKAVQIITRAIVIEPIVRPDAIAKKLEKGRRGGAAMDDAF
jgi:hypothetical protein